MENSPLKCSGKDRASRALHAAQGKWDYARMSIVEYYVEVAAVLSQDKKSSSGSILLEHGGGGAQAGLP